MPKLGDPEAERLDEIAAVAWMALIGVLVVFGLLLYVQDGNLYAARVSMTDEENKPLTIFEWMSILGFLFGGISLVGLVFSCTL